MCGIMYITLLFGRILVDAIYRRSVLSVSGLMFHPQTRGGRAFPFMYGACFSDHIAILLVPGLWQILKMMVSGTAKKV